MLTRKAILPDAAAIERLVGAHTADGTLLPRTLREICEDIRDFVVAVDESGRIAGCGALQLYGMHLAEIRSITVASEYRGKGIGRLLVDALMKEAKHQHVTCVCLFTRVPEFFGHLGFREADRDALPDKLYKDCLRCPRYNNCDEVAMVRGEMPKFAHLPERVARPRLVEIAH